MAMRYEMDVFIHGSLVHTISSATNNQRAYDAIQAKPDGQLTHTSQATKEAL